MRRIAWPPCFSWPSWGPRTWTPRLKERSYAGRSGSWIQLPGLNGGTADLRLNIRDQGSFFMRWDVLSLPEELFEAHSRYYDPGDAS